MNLRHGFPVAGQVAKNTLDGGLDSAEIFQHQTGALFTHPVGIVAFLGERPGIALDDYRKSHGDGFADAAGAGLSDEEVGQAHVVRNLRSEAFHKVSDGGGEGAEAFGKLPIAAANKDELDV